VAVSLLSNTARYLMHSSCIAVDLMPMGNLLLFLLSVPGSAALARGFGRRFVLSSSEWVTVFCTGFVSALGPIYGISGYLVSRLYLFDGVDFGSGPKDDGPTVVFNDFWRGGPAQAG